MRVHFLPDEGLSPLQGNLVYNTNDSAFDFEPFQREQLMQRIGTEGLTSLVIETLQIEVAIGTLIALFVWGYYPQAAWKHGNLPPVDAQPGGLRIALLNEHQSELDPGISIGLVEINEWQTIFDPDSGWLRIGSGSPDTDNHSRCIEFATDTIAVIKDDILTAMWLHPRIR